jgi:hypothetical protein
MSGDQSPFPPPVVIFHKTFGNSVSQCVNFLRTGSKIAKSTKRHATTKRTKHAKDSETYYISIFCFVLFATFVVKCFAAALPGSVAVVKTSSQSTERR